MSAEKTKSVYAYEELKSMLLGDQFEKNKIIPTGEIAERIGMGRAPVLEALKRLESERYVMIIPQKGIMVREMTLQEMREINDVRIALESFIAMRVAESFTDEDVLVVEGLLKEQQAAEAEGNPKRFIKYDELFHLYLYEKTENSLLIDLMQRLRERFFNVGLYILMRPDRMKSTLEEHNDILEALRMNDGIKAQEAMVRHIESGKSRIA